MTKRRICVVTGSRAEYGLLHWLMRQIQADARLELLVAVTGMHLSPEFGSTVSEIERDGMPIAARIETQLSSDSRVGMAKSLGLGLLGFADAFERLRPDVVVVLGDRYEILAAAQAAALLGIPVAHISGGEVTVGAVDDWIRHCITKVAWFHFVAAEPYRRRVIQLGEEPSRVFSVGDPGLDAVKLTPERDREELAAELGVQLGAPLFLVTFHPATLSGSRPGVAFAEVLAALDRFPSATVIMTKPNADAGGHELSAMAEAWCAARGRSARFVTSLGQGRYLALMRHCDAVIGNSSSGIIEAPAVRVATVNIGERQEGRLMAESIISCAADRMEIAAAVERALSIEFMQVVVNTESLYGDCDAARRIKEILATSSLPRFLAKPFHDA